MNLCKSLKELMKLLTPRAPYRSLGGYESGQTKAEKIETWL